MKIAPLKPLLTICAAAFSITTAMAQVQPGSEDAEAGRADAKSEKSTSGSSRSLSEQIAKACEERQMRMLAMNDAMLKLRQAGNDDDALRLERRLLAMIEVKDPREDDAVVANKTELEAMKTQLAQMSEEIQKLTSVLGQNSRIIDEILSKAVPDVSPAVMEELKLQAGKKPDIRKAP